jgi:alpha/beta superfamily hydrolase
MEESYLIEERLQFPSQGLSLEGLLSYRSDYTQGGKVLLLSPHPHFAGDMNNNVIRALARALGEAQHLVFRFNYHGVEGSEAPALEEGSIFDYWREVEEKRDYARAMADSLAAHAVLEEAGARAGKGAYAAGYSFGSLIAALAAPRMESLEGLILISPPFMKIDLSQLVDPGCPVLILAGAKDFVFDQAALVQACARLGREVQTIILDEGDHFFRGQEANVAEKVKSFIKK